MIFNTGAALLDAIVLSVVAKEEEGTYGYKITQDVRKGIDVSKYQGNINWNAAKNAGVEFAIVRVGHRGKTSGSIEEDSYYATNIQGALNAGIRVGAYIYSQAISEQEAVEEANFVLSRVYSYNITLPVVIDYEYDGEKTGRLYTAGLSNEQRTSICNAFCNTVRNAGYTPMVYANKWMLEQQLNAASLSSQSRIWLANYVSQTSYAGNYDFWQYSSTGNGASYGASSQYIDLDYWYDDGTIYGKDYGTVFDAEYYANTYLDVRNAYGTNAASLLQHFINFGMKEGRRGNENFDVYSYRARYSDLQKAYGDNLQSYYLHYMQCGYKENRNGSPDQTQYTVTFINAGNIVSTQQVVYGHAATAPQLAKSGATLKWDRSYNIITADTTVTGQWYYIYNGVDYTALFDADYYLTKYSDLKKAFGNDGTAALKHFVNNGMKEARQAKDTFNVRSYKNRYWDLRKAYGNDWKSYFMHYINYGQKENRTGTGSETTIWGAATVYNGVDYSAVYDVNYYLAHNSDVLKAYGYDENNVLQHFVLCGMKEGRQAKDSFNMQSYKNRYWDLRKAYGNDKAAYYRHYITYGQKENRAGTGSETTIWGAATVYKGVDYSAVYDANYYLSHHADVLKAYGYDENGLLQHFVLCGMKEGRHAKDDFNVQVYKNRYADLRKAYGNDLKQYYLHYINYGKKEGRKAV